MCMLLCTASPTHHSQMLLRARHLGGLEGGSEGSGSEDNSSGEEGGGRRQRLHHGDCIIS